MVTALPRSMTPAETAFFKAVGGRIAQYRRDADLTQVQLADALGIPQPQLASYEIGRRRLPLSLIPQLARELAVGIEDLIGEEPRPGGKRGPTPKLLQQMERIQRLPRARQRFLMEMIETALQQSAR